MEEKKDHKREYYFKPGNQFSKGKGRPKGAKDKLAMSVKEAVLKALDKVGGVDYLCGVAENNPQVFCALLGKILPTQVSMTDSQGNPTEITVKFVDAG